MAKYIIISCAFCLFLSVGSRSFAAFTEAFATSAECEFCHDSGPNALIDSAGNDLSIADDWSSTMMGNSFKDPLFRAKLESELSRTPHLAAAIEDKCLTCHTPMARTQALRNGAQHYSLAMAESSDLAWDGVSCALCHQIANEGLGSEASFSGNYLVGGQRKIFGPYKEVLVRPMINHVNYLPTYGAQVDKPELCATCHTLFTPYVDEQGNIAGEFPEQTPYLEWLNSTYASSENYQSCQDCHMPRIDEPVKITNRPPWYQFHQSPFWKHHFIGGNRFILEMMRDNRERLGIGVPEELFERTISRTEERLSQEAAELTIERVIEHDSRLEVDLHIVNKTGHKFPTGFPSRRAWLHLKVTDAEGLLLFESGGYDAQGDIINQQTPYEPHHAIIDSPGQTLIYQAVMGDVAGTQTDTLLRAATYLKDNRLPPRGYRGSGEMVSYTSISGEAAGDENFNGGEVQEGSGADTVTYAIEVNDALYPLTIEAQLLYQSNSPRFLEDLIQDDIPAVSRFKKMYSDSRNSPVVVDSIRRDWNE